MKKIQGANYLLLLVLIICITGAYGQDQQKRPVNVNNAMKVDPNEYLSKIKLPPGFKISMFAEHVENARSMTLSSNGTLFVGTRRAGKVYAILDKNKDFKADQVVTIAENLNMSNGVAMRDGNLYVAEVDRILRFDNIEENLSNPPEPIVINDTFPKDRHHGWKFIRFGPDGKLYVPVGAPCNICEREEEIYATITRIDPDGLNLEIFSKGIRNTVGFDWHPETQELWFTENGRDLWGDDRPPEELNHAPRAGLHFGFPYRYGKALIDTTFKTDMKPADFEPAAFELPAHTAALGMRFYTGKSFPKEYHKQIFIAEHGSWNRSNPDGYCISVVRLKENRAVSYERFATGWLVEDKYWGRKYWGRPVDLEVLPDGSLLVSDDFAYCIYRISFSE
ncbi:sorbosone dehydrogenase family protein [candidate division KSB1 bacterium]|nr:sorbosone dehydrogenase family protein [candidate division KSB1 bacterium]